MALRDLWRKLTGRGEPEDKEPDAREGRSLYASSEQAQQRSGPQWHKPTDQEKPKH